MKSGTVDLIKHLRIPFSVLLLPVFLFAAGAVMDFSWTGFWLAFFVLHLLVYPASNGYNSLMDSDNGSIGGLKHPPTVPKGMLWVTISMNAAALLITFLWDLHAFFVLLAYILASKAYSWRGIRLKKYPIAGFLTVVMFQGAAVYYFSLCMISIEAIRIDNLTQQYIVGLILSSLMIASSYPLTQVYQHEQDREDGVMTISCMLGVKGTFLFSMSMLIFFIVLLFFYLSFYGRLYDIIVFLFCTLQVTAHFFKWFKDILEDESAADFENSMKMNFLGALGMNLFFSWLFFASQVF